MPQMSPLFWANLFIAFSLLLLVSFIKIYFSSSKHLEISKAESSNNKETSFNWKW